MKLGLVELLIWMLLYYGAARLYILIASRYKIVDHPNHRSSHEHVTIRGGGIIFWLAISVGSVVYSFFSIQFGVAFFLVGILSFVDDLRHVPAGYRMLFQVVLISSLFVLDEQLRYNSDWNLLVIGVALIAFGGGLNIYNFMDGINGLNGCYTLLSLITLYFLDSTHSSIYAYAIVPIALICFFNARPKGKAIFFSGDIGSISAGFFILYSITLLNINNQTVAFYGLVLVYLVDGGWTIILRLTRGENIFQAHRSHIFQLLANELDWGHLRVTLVYILVQLAVNLSLHYVIQSSAVNANMWLLTVFIVLSIVYFIIRHFIVNVESSRARIES